MGQALERELPETPNATCSRQCQPRADAGWVRDVRDENVEASPVTNSRKGSRVLPGDRLDGIGCPGELAGGVVLTEHGHSGHARDQRARGRREGERREAGQEHPAAAEPIAQRGAGQDQRGEGQADSPWPSLDNGHKALTDRDLNMSANRLIETCGVADLAGMEVEPGPHRRPPGGSICAGSPASSPAAGPPR